MDWAFCSTHFFCAFPGFFFFLLSPPIEELQPFFFASFCVSPSVCFFFCCYFFTARIVLLSLSCFNSFFCASLRHPGFFVFSFRFLQPAFTFSDGFEWPFLFLKSENPFSGPVLADPFIPLNLSFPVPHSGARMEWCCTLLSLLPSTVFERLF